MTDIGIGTEVLPPDVREVTIRAGESESDVVDLTGLVVVVMFAPDDWSPANISFLVSPDKSHWSNLYDVNGVEVIKPIPPGSAMLIDLETTRYISFMKIRSGPHDNPVPQVDDRSVLLVTAPA